MQVTAIKTQKLTGEENLFDLFLQTNITLQERDILVVTSKIVSLSQGRIRNISDYGENEKEAKEKLIQEEADRVYPGKYTFTLKDGILIPFAGIDLSNIPEGKILLWPEKPYEFSKDIHIKLCQHFGIQNLGVIISDSRCTPLRWGVTGLALAWYGFQGVEDVRGEKDLFDRPLEVTRKAVADNLATAAMTVQGEGSECTPFALIQNAPADFSRKDDWLENSRIDPEEDIFASILKYS